MIISSSWHFQVYNNSLNPNLKYLPRPERCGSRCCRVCAGSIRRPVPGPVAQHPGAAAALYARHRGRGPRPQHLLPRTPLHGRRAAHRKGNSEPTNGKHALLFNQKWCFHFQECFIYFLLLNTFIILLTENKICFFTPCIQLLTCVHCCVQYSLSSLERALLTYLSGDTSQPFDASCVPSAPAPVVTPSSASSITAAMTNPGDGTPSSAAQRQEERSISTHDK